MTAGKVKKLNLNQMTKVSLLGVIAFILMSFRFPIPIAPAFMDIDISELPALLATFSMGPFYGVLVVIIKLVLKMLSQGSVTFGVGELSNLIVSSTFVVVAGIVYKFNRTKKGAVISLLVGVVSMSIVATLSNTFFVFPLYAKAAGLSLDEIASTVSRANSLVKDFNTLMLFSIFPFNLVKGALTSVITFLVYKRIGRFLKG